MEQENDAGYYRRREAMTRQLAQGSSDPQIRRIHLEMAERCAEKAHELSGRPKLTIVPE